MRISAATLQEKASASQVADQREMIVKLSNAIVAITPTTSPNPKPLQIWEEEVAAKRRRCRKSGRVMET
eukprot:4829342-Karenia_brevis.AAC.1